jgi:hypothetical protein
MAQNEVTFVIDSDGRTLFLVSECMEGSSLLEYAKIARASHVCPDNWALRILFHVLRYFVGDKGRMSEFTRKWPCLWRVEIVNGPVLPGRYRDRKEAIAAEIEYLNQRFIGEKHD